MGRLTETLSIGTGEGLGASRESCYEDYTARAYEHRKDDRAEYGERNPVPQPGAGECPRDHGGDGSQTSQQDLIVDESGNHQSGDRRKTAREEYAQHVCP
jgi:hypothetical protein